MSHGAGGARVLIDPDSLRSAAARLRATVGELGSVRASLGGVGWPAMPPGLLVVAQNAVAEAQAAAQGSDRTVVGDGGRADAAGVLGGVRRSDDAGLPP
jgi:hypothetical protein